MQIGDVLIFKKSGNEVVLIEQVAGSSPVDWIVERTKGESAGKRMICRESSLLTPEQFND